MPTTVIINANNKITELQIKKIKLDDLYKKCNFRKKDGFGLRTTWSGPKETWVSVFSRNDGRAGTENKYDFPPPIDTVLYFGNVILLKHTDKIPTNENIVDFDKKEWGKLYEKLMGGFEDLGESDTSSEEEEIPAHLLTKQGYFKDDFVVEDGKGNTESSGDTEGKGTDDEIDGSEEDTEDSDDDGECEGDSSGDDPSNDTENESGEDIENDSGNDSSNDSSEDQDTGEDQDTREDQEKDSSKAGNNLGNAGTDPDDTNKHSEDNSELSEEEYD